MIAHVFIKNYKAFKRETIMLGDHTLFLGTHNSGKTTVLDALNAFFNHRVERDYVRNKRNDVVIECFIDNQRFRKVFSPPHFTFNAHKSIGDFRHINHLHYVYIPFPPAPFEAIFNQVLATTQSIPEPQILDDAFKAFPLFFEHMTPAYQRTHTPNALRLKQPLSRKEQKLWHEELLNYVPLEHVILAIDHVEQAYPDKTLQTLIDKTWQSFITTRKKQIVDVFPYHTVPLFKSSVKKEVDTITESVSKQFRKTFILVEGKYDVPWFEQALNVLEKDAKYRVLPCGGYGNIQFVERQLKKANFNTIVITDGDASVRGYKLTRDIIELYAEVETLNRLFQTDFSTVPKSKHALFRAIRQKDDVVKQLLANWARSALSREHAFTHELAAILSNYENQ